MTTQDLSGTGRDSATHKKGTKERLLSSAQTQHKMESRLLLNIVVGQGTAVLELLACKDQTLLIRRNPFLVLDLCFDIVNRVGRFNFQGDRLACERLDKDLHATAETENQMQRRFLLNVVVRQGAAVLKLFASEDETLLVGGDALLVLNLGLDVVYRI